MFFLSIVPSLTSYVNKEHSGIHDMIRDKVTRINTYSHFHYLSATKVYHTLSSVLSYIKQSNGAS